VKRILAVALAAVAATALVSADFADARRLGGGRSLGAQRQSIAPPAQTPPSAAPNAPAGAATNPVMPAQPGAAASRAAPGAAAAPASGASRWLGPIAGLAAGLGLAALAAHLGISEALMSVLLVALIAFAAIALLRFAFARREPARPAMP
jgi:predicted lipid-binding transport protein (Tim44 family)